MLTIKLKDYKEKKTENPEFAKAYEEIQPELNVIRTAIEAQTSQTPYANGNSTSNGAGFRL